MVVVVGGGEVPFLYQLDSTSAFFPPELEVARMSTDGNLPDLKFPQTGGQGNAIHLSASTLKQHGRNGELSFSEPAFIGCPLLL